ncbi:hypothetical protein EDD86DRAFT_202864 [Gorgonomyces haynaldii]|nr:hypothetical protein EDD86DRAFT_202864 [Gorgonomyces haynaldii]
MEPFHEVQKIPKPIKTMSWSPKRDLVALLFQDGSLELYRLWERALILDEHASGDLLQWNPLGTSLALLDSKTGKGLLFSIETGMKSQLDLGLHNEEITMMDWTHVLKDFHMDRDYFLERNQADMTLLFVGTNNGRFIARLNGTLLVRDFNAGGSIVSTIVDRSSFTTLSVVKMEQFSLLMDACPSLEAFGAELSQISKKCSEADAVFGQIKQSYELLLKEMQTIYKTCFLELFQAMEDAFSGDEEPGLHDWQRFAMTGQARMNLIQLLSQKMTQKHLRTWEHQASVANIRISQQFLLISRHLETLLILIMNISSISGLSKLFNISEHCKQLEQHITKLAIHISEMESQYTQEYISKQEFIQYLQSALTSLKQEDQMPLPDHKKLKSWLHLSQDVLVLILVPQI